VITRGKEHVVETTRGPVTASFLVNCAGLQCDRIARLCGLVPDVRIIPFRGEYWEVVAERRYLVRHLVYPIPDPSLPFLGVHFTQQLDGRVKVGPNAVLALKREGYGRRDVDLHDCAAMLGFSGFWRLAGSYWKVAAREWLRSASKDRFARCAAELVPDLRAADLTLGPTGVRAQAVDRQGRLLDDFHIFEDARSIHVLNAPSPAATASLSIARTIAQRASARLL
jgi:L-2-hydroxyglutarate oxidase